MAHVHDHDHHRSANRRALTLALLLTSGFMVVEVVGGFLTDSLALLADAGHMLSDAFSLGLALFAVWLAERPATPQRSFGYQRAEILAALANGLALVVVSVWIFIEAYGRLDDPPEVLGGWLLAIALVGLLVNLVAAFILRRGKEESLNVSAAMRHVLADLAGSVGVIVAAVVILTTGWRYVDPLVSILIGLLVLASAWPILRDSIRILLEASPRGIDPDELGRSMASLPGIKEVHDLHVWTITSGFPALSAHVLVGEGDDCHARRRELEELLHERFGIQHTTLQVDHEHHAELIELEMPEQRSAPVTAPPGNGGSPGSGP
jgi:cobalt-zinc-cadmium efflux system protein